MPLTPRLVSALKAHFATRRFAGSLFVFHHETTRRHAHALGRIKSLRDGFRAAAKRAKLPAGLHQHDLRHRRITTWLAEGKNAVHVKEAVGHSDLRTTMAYTHLAREHLRALVHEAPAAAAEAARDG